MPEIRRERIPLIGTTATGAAGRMGDGEDGMVAWPEPADGAGSDFATTIVSRPVSLPGSLGSADAAPPPSPSGVPPGSWVEQTSTPSSANQWAARRSWVLLPLPSRPSKVMNRAMGRSI